MIGLISTENNLLFEESIEYNICYGNVGTLEIDDIENAAKFAKIYEKILNSQFGFSTMIGFKNSRLSQEDYLRVLYLKCQSFNIKNIF